jgi:hypothetical protein
VDLQKVKIGKNLVSKLEQMVDLCFLGANLRFNAFEREFGYLNGANPLLCTSHQLGHPNLSFSIHSVMP